MTRTVLLVDDNADIVKINREALRLRDYRVLSAQTIAEARQLLEREQPDCIVLDIMLPDGDGVRFCDELRGGSDTPILFLSAKSRNTDVIGGLAAGGDDYLTKPYDLDILCARVAALMRRRVRMPQTLTLGLLRLELAARQAFLGGKDLLLTPKEFALLLVFAQHQGKPFKADNLYEKVWGQAMGDDDNALRVMVSKLRRKLVGSGYTIITTRKEGYRFERE